MLFSLGIGRLLRGQCRDEYRQSSAHDHDGMGDVRRQAVEGTGVQKPGALQGWGAGMSEVDLVDFPSEVVPLLLGLLTGLLIGGALLAWWLWYRRRGGSGG